MANVDINEDHQAFLDTFKTASPSVTFENKLLSYEFSKAEFKNPPQDNSIPKFFTVKKISPKLQKIHEFEYFLKKILDFQNNTLTPNLLRIHSVFKKENSYFLVQRDYEASISKKVNGYTELEVLILLKEIVKFYFQLMDEEDVFNQFVQNNFPFKPLSPELIFYYRSVPKNDKKPRKYKLKIDMFSFENTENFAKLDEKSFHLSEFENLVKELLKTKKDILGACSRNLLRKIEEKILWKDLFTHPLFNVDITVTPNFDFWKISFEDRKKIKKVIPKVLEEEKNEDVTKTMRVAFNPQKFELLNEPNIKKNQLEKSEENAPFNVDLVKNIGKSKLKEPNNLNKSKNTNDEIKKSQILPIPNRKEIQIEDDNNNQIEIKEKGVIVLNPGNNQGRIPSTTCGDCRCI